MADKTLRMYDVYTNTPIDVLYHDNGNSTYSPAPAMTTVAPAAQASTNAYVTVAGSLLTAIGMPIVSYTVTNTGAQTISWKVMGGNDPALSDLQEVKAAADLAAAAIGSFSTAAAVWSYYVVQIIDKVGGSHGAGTVYGVAK